MGSPSYERWRRQGGHIDPAPPPDDAIVAPSPLSPCPDCQHLVSRHARACPQCGRVQPLQSDEQKRRTWTLILVLLSLAGLFWAFGKVVEGYRQYTCQAGCDRERLAYLTYEPTCTCAMPSGAPIQINPESTSR